MAATKSLDLDVLIADDDLVTRNILKLYLEAVGCRVQAVSNGNEALSLVSQSPSNRIGALILDVKMPGPPSPELYERLRQIRPSVPILFCSGASPEDPLIREIDEHGWPLLPKPFHRAELVEALCAAVEQAGSVQRCH